MLTRSRSKISPALEAWAINANLAATSEGGDLRALSGAWFKKLKVKAIQEGRMTEGTCTFDGLRQCARDFFKDLAEADKATRSAPDASLASSSGSHDGASAFPLPM